jgi:hypothetical protein
MSESEEKQIRAMALLEAEEAKAALALLRSKANRWIAFHDLVARALSLSKREPVTAIVDPDCQNIRRELENAIPSCGEAMNVSAIFALDDEMKAACLRVQKAEAEKKALGFGVS